MVKNKMEGELAVRVLFYTWFTVADVAGSFPLPSWTFIDQFAPSPNK